MTDTAILTNLDAIVADARAIIFDWNGTLVDDALRALAATNQVLTTYSRAPLDLAEFSARFKLPLPVFLRDLGVDAADRAGAQQLWNRGLAQGETRLQPGAAALLQLAHRTGLTLGVVSAAAEEVVRADAVTLGIDRYLSFIAGSIADKFAALTDISARFSEPMLYIGDTEYDMAAAHAAGAIPIGYGRGYRPRSALIQTEAFAVIDDYDVLSAALTRRRS